MTPPNLLTSPWHAMAKAKKGGILSTIKLSAALQSLGAIIQANLSSFQQLSSCEYAELTL